MGMAGSESSGLKNELRATVADWVEAARDRQQLVLRPPPAAGRPCGWHAVADQAQERLGWA